MDKRPAGGCSRGGYVLIGESFYKHRDFFVGDIPGSGFRRKMLQVVANIFETC